RPGWGSSVRLATRKNIRVQEVPPPQLPDLFWGSQLVVLGKYSGYGAAAVKLTGQVGKETREFAYDVTFPAKTVEDREFVEHLWARRKVGFLLDQIRINGEQKELMDEMLGLAKKYGIATPYTSYLVVPDAPVPVAGLPMGGRDGAEGAPDRSALAVPGTGTPGPVGGAPAAGGKSSGGLGFGGGFGGGGPGRVTPNAPPPAVCHPR